MTEDAPAWWEENARLREEFDLPEYDPPRFSDGTYTHEVVPGLEEEYGCTIRFKGIDTRYPDDWTVYVDGRPAFPVERRRDADGNTVYELSADEFEATLREYLRG